MKPRKSASGQGVILPDWHRRLVYAGCLLVGASGLMWFVSNDLLKAEPNDFQRWLLMLHGAGSFAACMIFGSMLPQHVRIGWKAQRNRSSGVVIFGIFGILIITAYLLYYGAGEWHDYTRWTHIVVGIFAFMALPLHIWIGRHKRLKAHDISVAIH